MPQGLSGNFLEFYPFKKRLCELQESDVGSLSITSLKQMDGDFLYRLIWRQRAFEMTIKMIVRYPISECFCVYSASH